MSSRQIKSFHIDVCVLEDLHAGSGLGGADIDALLALDRQGRPTIRWSHLRGLLKQALVDRCDALEIEPGVDLVTLFGTPQTGPSQAFHRGTLMGHSLRPTGAWGTPIVWASTARKPLTRVPKTETLRRVEHVPAGTKFSGYVRICDDGNSGDLVAKLLKRVNRLGGDRRRGAGLVKLTALPSTMEPAVVQPDPNVRAPNAGRHRVLFRALDPVGLAATSEPGNVIRGHSHMSPATVHGMLVRWAMESGNTAFAQALLERHLVCGPAYPVPPQAMESPLGVLDVVPFPLSFQAGKPLPQLDGWPWWATPAMPDGWIDTLSGSGQPDARPRSEKLKRPGEHDYLVHTASGWMRFGCNPGQSMRNDAGTSQRDGLKQNLRTVEEVPEDTGFLTCIVATDASAEALLQPILRELQQSGHWLQAGRGGTPMVVRAHEEAVVKSISPSGAGDQCGGRPTGTAVRIFVESDLILRAPDLRFHTRLDRAAILALLEQAGTAADDLMGFSNDLSLVKEVSEPTEIRGRNVAASGPRLPALAIRRGSEAMLYFYSQERAEQCRHVFAAIARHGVGERSAEGHGRLRVDFAPASSNGMELDLRTDAIHADEALLEDVSIWLGRKGMDPKLFTSTRWQSLRNAARANDPRTISQWFDQAFREQKRLAKKGTSGAEALEDWLKELKARVSVGHGVTGALRPELRPFLRMLGLLAARQVKSLLGADGPANPGGQP